MTWAEAALVFGSVWIAVLAWSATEVLKTAGAAQRRWARAAWTLGAVLMTAHTAAAFHVRHAWSHRDAYETTARQSEALTGVAAGWGLYLNYLLVIVWVVDAAWWWSDAPGYASRDAWIDRAVSGFFLFMMFNRAVIFATTAMWMAGAVAVFVAAVAFARRERIRYGMT